VLDSFLDSVRREVLPNGLTLLTREHRRGSVVAINTWVKAGYFHEPDEVAGMAHLFEHMFFKGSKKYPGPEEIARHVSTLGGVSNAGTIYDSTNYYFVMPREGLARGIEIQADAILNPLFDPDELRKEAEVVIEESNRKLDNPPAVSVERMFATAFTRHRMRRWRIGSHDVLRNIRRDDLIAFFETLYRPANMILAVAGDISHQEVLSIAQGTFGALPRGHLRKERGPAEPPQDEFRFGESRADIRQSYSVFGWHIPGEHHPDEQALELLAAILGSGRYSRLYRGVVGPSAASSAVAFNVVHEDVGILTLRASYEDANLREVERRILREVERLKRNGPTAFELQLVRNKVESSLAFELEDVLGQARALSMFEARGNYLEMREHLRRIGELTADDIRGAAERYLRPENMTLYRYRPNAAPMAEVAAVRTFVDETLLSFEGGGPAEVELPALPSAISVPTLERPIQRFVLGNGMTVFVREALGTPSVSTSLFFRGGRLHEHSGNAGLTQLMARAMRRGTASRSAEQIDREIEFLGTQLGLVVNPDFFGLSLDILSKNYRAGLELLSDVVLRPSFPEQGVEEERHLQLASIQRSFDSSLDRPLQLFNQALYGNHPYGIPDAGYASSVAVMERRMIADWYRSTVSSDAGLLVVVGEVAAEEVRDLAESLFGSLRKSETLKPPVPELRPPAAPTELTESRDRRQTVLVIGFPTVPPQHPDWAALRLLQDVTSGLAGTFFAELRGRRSLAYTVNARDMSYQWAGAFVGYIATEAGKEQQAREALLREISRLGEDGVSEGELERAKSQLAGTIRIRLQTNSAIASDLAQKYLYGLGLDFTERFLERIRHIRLDEVRDVAKKYLSNENHVVAILRGRA
jgi:zinc protease